MSSHPNAPEPRKGRLTSLALTILIALASLALLAYGVHTLWGGSDHDEADFDPAAQQEYDGVAAKSIAESIASPSTSSPSATSSTPTPAADATPAQESQSPDAETTPTPAPTTSAASTESASAPSASSSLRPGEADMTLITPEQTEHPGTAEDSPEDSPMYNYLVSEQGEVVADIPSGVKDSWQCQDASGLKDGQLTWSQASRLSGSAIFIPDLCLAVPTVEAPLGIASDGSKQLQLAPTPWATHYDQTPQPGSGAGNSIFASHVNYRSSAWGPFRLLREIDSGTPIVARNADGSYHVYTETDTREYDRAEVPNLDGMFRTDGPETLTLITCDTDDDGDDGHFGQWSYFTNNLVVTASAVD